MAEHYFSERPEVPSHRRTVRLSTWGCDVELVTDAGVFSPKRVDSGTQRLLDAHSLDGSWGETGALLDLGCGYGPIAITLAMRYPQALIWAVDVNERARALTQENRDRLGLTNIQVCAPEDVPEGTRFSAIVSNPPMKSGKTAFQGLCEQWLPALRSDGVAYLVIAKNLGADSLARWLTGQGWAVERVSSGGGYRIFALGGRTNRG